MRTNFYSVAVSVTKYLLAAGAIFLSFGISLGTVQAAVINFDALEYFSVEDDHVIQLNIIQFVKCKSDLFAN